MTEKRWLTHHLEYLTFFFRDMVTHVIPCCAATHSVDQAGLKLRDPPASASQVLGLKEFATSPTTAQLRIYFLNHQIGIFFSMRSDFHGGGMIKQYHTHVEI